MTTVLQSWPSNINTESRRRTAARRLRLNAHAFAPQSKCTRFWNASPAAHFEKTRTTFASPVPKLWDCERNAAIPQKCVQNSRAAHRIEPAIPAQTCADPIEFCSMQPNHAVPKPRVVPSPVSCPLSPVLPLHSSFGFRHSPFPPPPLPPFHQMPIITAPADAACSARRAHPGSRPSLSLSKTTAARDVPPVALLTRI